MRSRPGQNAARAAMPVWPDIPLEPWRETSAALQLYAQVIGKYRLARTPWINHSWHATLYVSGRGLTTSLVPDGPGGIEIALDLIDHAVLGAASDGRTARLPLGPMSVAAFHAQFLDMIRALGGTARLNGAPSELADAVPFARDDRLRPYDADAVTRYYRALVLVDAVLKRFRTGFLGKASPVHLFWGAFDLAVTRFSGRAAPRHPGGVPGLPDAIAREAYSHEVSSAGFWPGGGPVAHPAFYAYAYPEPAGFAQAQVRPDAAYYHPELREFVLPYDAVRLAPEPDAVLLDFLQSTYGAAAELGAWARRELETPLAEPLRPRPVA